MTAVILVVLVILLARRVPRRSEQCPALSGFLGLWGYQCDLRRGHACRHIAEVYRYRDGSRGTISWK